MSVTIQINLYVLLIHMRHHHKSNYKIYLVITNHQETHREQHFVQYNFDNHINHTEYKTAGTNMQFNFHLYIMVVITIHLNRSSMNAEAKLVLSLILNGGVLPTNEGYDCNEQDSQLIDSAIGSDSGDDDDDDRRRRRRHLSTYPARCKNLCLGYAPRTCRVTGCMGYRRRSLSQETTSVAPVSYLRSSVPQPRQLDDDSDDAAICAAGLLDLNTKLDQLIPQLSTSCQSVVQNHRTVSCFDDVRFASVSSFTLWNADTDTVIQANLQNNTSFCYTNRTLNIEAVANACVDEINMSIQGPVSRSREIESLPPYSIFGNVDSYNFTGRILPVGTYTVRTTLEGSLTPISRVTFSVRTC